MTFDAASISTRYAARQITLLLMLLAPLFFAPALLAGEDDADAEKAGKVKAAFVLNFVKFTTWPAERFADADAPLVILVLDDEKFLKLLRATVADKTVGGRAIEVQPAVYAAPPHAGDDQLARDRRAALLESLNASHLVYCGEAEKRLREDIVKAAGEADVLTVGDGDDFAPGGGMIGLVLQERKIIFEVNLEAVNDSNIKLSSKLLALARIVKAKT